MGEFHDRSNLGLLQINILRGPADVALVLSGELDISTEGLLREAFERVEPTVDQLLLDLSGLRFIDASGLGTIAELGTELGERLSVRSGLHRALFALTALDLTLKLVPSLPESLQPSTAERNIKYVRELYVAWWIGGVKALAARVPAHVEWEPTRAEGILNGTAELLEFWGDAAAMPTVRSAWFTAIDNDVMIESEHQLGDGRVERVNALYEFDGSTLIRAISVPSAYA